MWPQVLTRAQVVNMLEQYTFWYNDKWVGEDMDLQLPTREPEEYWVALMEDIDPCWPREEPIFP